MALPPGAPVAGAGKLAVLCAPDSMFENGTAEAYSEFLKAGGTVSEANQSLVESFHGLPMMVNTLSRWTDMVGGNSSETVNNAIGTLFRENFQVRTADRAFDRILKNGDGTDTISVPSPRSNARMMPDFLTQVAKAEQWQKIAEDPKFRSSVLVEQLRQFSGMTDEAVGWVQSPEGCVKSFSDLLDELIRKSTITADDLRHFYKVVADRATYDENTMTLTLRVIAGIRNEASDGDLKQMLRRCSQEVCNKAVQKAVANHGLTEGEAAKFTFTIATRVEIDASGVRVPDSLLADLWAVSTVKSSVARKSAVVVDKEAVKRIQELYGAFRVRDADGDEEVLEISKIGESDRPTYLSALCNPYMLRCMDKKLFVQSFRAPYAEAGNAAPFNSEERGCLCMLVALAYTFQVMREPGGDGTSVGSWDSAERQRARKLEDILLLCVKSCAALYPQCWGRTFTETAETKETAAKETAAKATAAKETTAKEKAAKEATAKGTAAKETVAAMETAEAKETAEANETHIAVLRRGIEESLVVARGVVLWAREGLLSNPKPERLRTSAPWYIELLELVAERYVVLRHDVQEVFFDVYEHDLWNKTDAMRNSGMEEVIRRFYGKALVSLLRLQMGTDMINTYREKFASKNGVMEALYLREFVAEVVELISEPFSVPFAEALLGLLGEERVIGAFRALEKKGDPKLNVVKERVESFVKSCVAMVNLDPHSVGLAQRVRAAYGSMVFR